MHLEVSPSVVCLSFIMIGFTEIMLREDKRNSCTNTNPKYFELNKESIVH